MKEVHLEPRCEDSSLVLQVIAIGSTVSLFGTLHFASAVLCLELQHPIDHTLLTVTLVTMSLWDKAVESLKDKHKYNIDFQRTDKGAILAEILEEI